MCVIRKYIFCVENQDVSYLQKYVLSLEKQGCVLSANIFSV